MKWIENTSWTTNKCLKVEKTMLPSLTINGQFYVAQALHVMPDFEQPTKPNWARMSLTT